MKISQMWGLAFVAFLAMSDLSFAAGPDFYLGVHTHFYKTPKTVDAQLEAMQKAHLNSFRGSISWENVETVRGQYKPTGIAIPEVAAVDEAIKRGLHPLLVLDFGNPLYEKDGLVTTAEAREGFAGYVRWLATRYKGKIGIYEVWNEWAYGMGSTAHPWKPGTVEQYAELIKTASAAVKSVDPQAKVIAASIGNYKTKWFQSLLDAGAGQYLDGFSVHPYNYSFLQGDDRNTPEASWAWVDQLHQLASRAQGRDANFYVTEIGWPTHVGTAGYTESEAAENLARFVIEGRSRSYVKGIWWYDLVDDGTVDSNREHHFGLLLPDMSEKVAYKTIKRIGELMKATDKLVVARDHENIAAHVVRDGRTVACAQWVNRGLRPPLSAPDAWQKSSIKFTDGDCRN